MQYKITETVLTNDTQKFIYKDLAEHFTKAMGFNGLSNDPVAFRINENEAYVAICVVQRFWGNLHIKYLMVKDVYRKNGLGQILMNRALRYGKK